MDWLGTVGEHGPTYLEVLVSEKINLQALHRLGSWMVEFFS